MSNRMMKPYSEVERQQRMAWIQKGLSIVFTSIALGIMAFAAVEMAPAIISWAEGSPAHPACNGIPGC